jgi:hypothetical protein
MSAWSMGALKRFSSAVKKDGNRFDVCVISPDAGAFDPKRVPFELQYAFDHLPESEEKVRALFERGYGLGIRTIRRAPERVLEAAERIRSSQAGVTEPWLSRLIFREEIPVFTEDELYEQNERGVNLFTEAHAVLGERFEMKRFVLVDLESHGIDEADREFLSCLNLALQPLSASYLRHRMLADRKKTARIRPARSFAAALALIGPVAHVLEGWVRGMGRLFAALADDVTRETADLMALKSSGYTGRQLWRQGRIFLPVFIIAAWLAFSSSSFAARGSFFTAGFLFGLAAVSFPFVEFVRSFAVTHNAYAMLEREGKLPAGPRPPFSILAFREMVRNPMRAGLATGVIASPFIAGLLFAAARPFAHNGWFLALVAMLDIAIALCFVRYISALDRILFIRSMRKRDEHVEIGMK